MIMHIEFEDGSNPYIFRGDAKECTKKYRDFAMYNGANMIPLFINMDGVQCRKDCAGYWYVGRYFDGAHKTKQYSKLCYALKCLEG